MSIFCKEFLAVYFAFENFSHIIWNAKHPVIVLTDNKALSSFFKAKTIPNTLWTYLDRLMGFNFVIGHIPGVANAAADYLSRVENDPNAILKLSLKDRIPVHEVEINIESRTPEVNNVDIAMSEMIFYAKEFTTIKLMKTADEQINVLLMDDPHGKIDLLNKMNPINIRIEQRKERDLVEIINCIERRRMLHWTMPTKYQDCLKKNFGRMMIKEGILMRQFFDHDGKLKYQQKVIPKHLTQELLYRIHNSKTMGHIGIQKTLEIYRQDYYAPFFTEQLIDYINNCLVCNQLKAPKKAQMQPPLQPLASVMSFPGETMQIDLVGRFPPSRGYTQILTGIDVFSRFLFAVPLRKVDAPSVAQALMNIFLTHTYIPFTIITDLGSVFNSELIKELTKLLEIQLQVATLKHAQTIGALERQHLKLKHFKNI